MSFDQESWERRWEQALREHGDQLSSRPPNASLVSVAQGLPRAAVGTGVDAVVRAVRRS